MAREPELSIKVKVDPQINPTELQTDINQKLPKDGVEIKGKLNAQELLRGISEYQKGGQNLVPILTKISNVDEALKAFENKETETKVSLKATQASLDTIRDQLQGVIDGLDYSKLEGASASTPTTSTNHTKKGKKVTAVDASTAAKQEIPVDVTGTISDDSVTALKTKIEAGLNDVAIVANIAPDQLSKIRKDVESAFNGIAITPTVKGVNGTAAQTGTKKKINIPSDDKIMEQMANAQYTATKNENAEVAAVKQKNIIYQNLADHQAKVSENASAATAKTAQGLSDANKAMGDLNAAAVDFEQDWRQVVTLIASATKNLANLMNSYKESSGLDVFSSFQEFQEELPDLDTEHVKPYLKSIKDWSDSLFGSAKGDFDSNTMIQAIHMLSGLADAWNNIDVSKLTDNKTKDKLLKEMSELNSIFPSSGDKEPFLGEKDAAINYLTDLLAKAAKYYAEVGNAAKQTADSIATANQGFANQAAQLEQTNAELEKAKRNIGNVFDPSLQAPISSDISEDSLSSLKTKIETGLGTIDVTPDVTAAHLTALRQKIETELNKIKFTPQPQGKNLPPFSDGGGSGKNSSRSDLSRNLVEQSQILNKQDTAANNKHYRNVNVQRNRKNDLEIQEATSRAELAKINPNYQNENWYEKAVLKAQYIRDDYTSAQADKADLDIIKKLNEAFKENIALREKLSRISKSQSLQDWNNVNSELRKSNHTIAKTGQQAVKQGVYLGNIKQNYSNQVKAIAEKARNKLFEEFEDELKQYISSGYRHVNATRDKNYEKATRLWSEQNTHKTNLDNIIKEMHARGYDKYNPQDNSGTYQKYIKFTQNRVKAENELAIAIKDRTDAQKDATAVDNSDISRLAKITAQLERQKHTLDGSDEGKASNVYSVVTKNASLSEKLTTDLDTHQGINKDLIARSWANKNSISGINSLADAYEYLRKEVDLASIEVEKFSDENVKLNKQLQNQVRVSNLQSQLHDYLEKFPKVEKKLNEQVSKLQNGLASPDAANNIKELSKQMAALRSKAKELGLETENLLDKFEKLFGQHLSTMIVMAALHKMQDAARQVYQNVVDIDTAMTELRKVTNETDATYVKFMEDAADRAQRVGATISDTITATADFARLGYNLEDASSISDTALIYKNVGDGISDINTASESLISTMQAFNIQAKDSMKIVDEFNEAGNNFAISSAGVGEALQRSGAALAAANNTMEQSIALATTMNRIIQNPETVGTTLKTVAMYLRSTKADVEAAGESTEGMAETTSKLRDSLKALSHGQVDIFDSATKQYKSTTDIIIEMGKAWDKMSDKEQAAALELMGGKRNANAVSALITNYQEIEKVIETVSNASGSAEAENAKYLDSIRGLLTELDSTFQAFSTHVFDSDVPKFFISTATAIVKAADAMVKFTGAFPMGAGILSFITQLGEPKMTGFMIVPSNTPGGDTEQVLRRYFIISSRSMREYLAKPTNMAA